MKKLVSRILSLLLLFYIGINVAGCGKSADNYSAEEHVQRITERIEKSESNWGYAEGEKYQDFQVYPLYNQNEELKYCLVEFAPYGFTFIAVRDETPVLISCLYPHESMYVRSATMYGKERPWTPYVRDENSPMLPSLIEGWFTDGRGEAILDENGDMIFYDKSPYFVTGNINQKKYLLETNDASEFICAVKEEGKFINLISGVELEDSKEYAFENNATLEIYCIPSKFFDL